MTSQQLSFFSADLSPPLPDDLDGLLAGPGQVVRRGRHARVSVLVRADEPWRAAAVLAALGEVGLDGDAVPLTGGSSVTVRSAFSPQLLPLAARWQRGATKLPPAGLVLDGSRLRWWCMAAGRDDGAGYLLGLGGHDHQAWQGIGAALQGAGLPGALLGPRAAGPAYRITGKRRLARLRELVGDPPAPAAAEDWPRG